MGQGVEGRKVFFLINQHAGGGAARSWWEKARAAVEESGLSFEWEYTDGGDLSGAQARRAVQERAARAVVAVGGDGTLYDVINGLIDGDKLVNDDLLFIAYPVGSACDFGRHIYGESLPELTELLKSGSPQPVDIGRCRYTGKDGNRKLRYYINSFDAGAGADTCVKVNARHGRLKKLLTGPLAFKLTALWLLLRYQYTDTVIEADGQVFKGQYIIIAATNGSYFGGGMQIAPNADMGDGKLELLAASRRSFFQILRVFSRLYDGTVLSAPDILYVQAREIKISSGRPLAIELDGEVPGFTVAELRALPGLLPVLTPDK